MFSDKKIVLIEKLVNAFELFSVLIILFMAFGFQLILNELPCPLCMLQRIGFACMAFGFILNLRYGFKPSHYSIIILSSLFTAFVALRQVALHVIPGTGAYGSAILGLHMYTWSFIASMLIIIGTTLFAGVDQQYKYHARQSKGWRFITNILFTLLTLLILSNFVSIILQCGFKACVDSPVRYELLSENQPIS